MRSESLIANFEYNPKMDRNISVLSNQSTEPPEDLSYAINILDAEIYIPNAEVYVSDIKEQEEYEENWILTISKPLSCITIIIIVVWFCLYRN